MTAELARELQSRFGGRFEGAAPELQGLIRVEGRDLKIELIVHRSSWLISIFDRGDCLASRRGEDPSELLAELLEQI